MKARMFVCFLVVVLVGVVAIPAFGQNLFVNALGGTNGDDGHSVVEVSDGGLVVTGCTESYGAGNLDLLLTKFDGSGNHLYTRTLGGTSDDWGYSVVEVSDGGLVLTGHTYSYGAGSSDLLLVKFDGSGNHLWARALGGASGDRGHSVVEVSDGGLVVTGCTESYGAGNLDLLLTKFDGSGNHLWTRSLGGTNGDDGYSVVEVSDDGLVVTGRTASYGAGTTDLLLAKFDGSGNHLWARALGGASGDRGYSVVEASDGGLVVTGYTYSYGAGSDDLFLAKFDADGNTCMGEFVTPTVQSVSPTITTWDPTVNTWSPTITSPDPTITSPTPTTTVVCYGDPEIDLTSPNGGEVWIDSCSYDITWSSTGPAIDHIKLLYSTDGGTTYPDTIIASTPNTGSYTWMVPSIISSTVRVKAQAEDASDSVLAWDESDTIFTVTLKGDVNSDCGINILDIIRMVNIILGNPPLPTEHELWAGDVNCSGGINILDIITEVNCILYGSEDCLFCSDKLAKGTRGGETATAWVSVLETNGSVGGQQLVPIGVEAEVPLAGVQLALEYNPDDVTIGEIQPTQRSQGFTQASNAESGRLTILLYSLSGKSIEPGNGPIVEIPIKATKDGGSHLGLHLREVILVGEGGQSLPTSITEAQPSTPLPTEYALAQNYPNPFNAITEMKYALAKDCWVSLEVYNVIGQKVATLVDGKQKAGYKTVRWDASLLSSGIYFYRLRAGDFVQTKKMILLR